MNISSRGKLVSWTTGLLIVKMGWYYNTYVVLGTSLVQVAKVSKSCDSRRIQGESSMKKSLTTDKQGNVEKTKSLTNNDFSCCSR